MQKIDRRHFMAGAAGVAGASLAATAQSAEVDANWSSVIQAFERRAGSLTRSSGSGRIGARSACPNSATGMGG